MADDVNQTAGMGAEEDLAVAGEKLAEAIEVDGAELSGAAENLAEALSTATPVTRDDLHPELESEYEELAEIGDDIVSHLVAGGVFEAVDDTLPPFDPDFLDACLERALESAEDDPTFETAGTGSDLAEYVGNCTAATEEIEQNVRWEPERSEKTSPMTTRGATEGVVDWLDDLGRHLWMSETLLSDEMLDDASTHTDALGSALLLIARGAAELDAEETDPEDGVAGIVGGIALHTYHQLRVPEDLSWITDEMRSPGAWAAD